MDKNYLEPVYGINRQKSFYRKAYVTTDKYGNRFLTSYKTVVAMIGNSGSQFRCWNGYSKTTLEHVKAFFERNISKKEWDAMEILNPETGEITAPDKDSQYRVVATSGFSTYVPRARFANATEADDLARRYTHGLWTAWVE